MKSVVLSLVAAMALWLGGTFTSSADAQYRSYYRGGYYSAPRYSRNYGYYPRYYSRGYYNYPSRSYYRPYYSNRYYGSPYYSRYYYGRPSYGGYGYGYRNYYSPGVSIGVGGVGIRAGF